MNIGILGGGQLGRMLALAGYPLGFRFRCYDPDPNAPAGDVAELVAGDFSDETTLAEFARGLDLVTYEFENVPAAVVKAISRHAPMLPAAEALATTQDRLTEKQRFTELGIPTASFASVNSRDELRAAIDRLGLPAVLKTRRFGYDGKGQFVLHDAGDADEAWAALGHHPLLLESFVPFERELSIIAARDRLGSLCTYPLIENQHAQGILRRSLAPAAAVPHALQQRAELYVRTLLDGFGYVGVLTIELFQHGENLLANEFAPRVHNSGHYSIEGAVTSQFENHLRAIAGLPLGATAAVGFSTMINLIGTLPDPVHILDLPGVHLHVYGKAPKPGRKLGHVTVVAASIEERDRLAARVQECVEEARFSKA